MDLAFWLAIAAAILCVAVAIYGESKKDKNREKNDTSAIKVCNNGSRDRHHHGSSQQAVCFTA